MRIGVVSTRNATDILEQTLAWHLNNGVDLLGVVVHLPTDEVLTIVDKFQDVLAAKLVITEPKYTQDQFMTQVRLQAAAKRKLTPQDWFIHFDDDERWTQLDCLDDIPDEAWAARTLLSTNYAPHSKTEHCFEKITHRDVRQTMAKLALRATHPLTTDQGNHGAYLPDGTSIPFQKIQQSHIGIDHFPVRTLAQFKKKVLGWEEVLHFRNGPTDPRSTHWVEWLSWHKQDPVFGLDQKFCQFMAAPQAINAEEQARLQGYGRLVGLDSKVQR